MKVVDRTEPSPSNAFGDLDGGDVFRSVDVYGSLGSCFYMKVAVPHTEGPVKRNARNIKTGAYTSFHKYDRVRIVPGAFVVGYPEGGE